MKKYWIIILLIFPLVAYSQISGQVSIPVDDIRFGKEKGYDKIVYGSSYFTEAGYPELPVVYKTFVIPKEATNLKLQSQITDTLTLDGGYLPYPVQMPQIISAPENPFTSPDSVIYHSTSVFPGVLAEIKSDANMHGYRIVSIAIYPVAFSPASGALSVREISYTLNYDMENLSDMSAPKISQRRFSLSKEFIRSMIDNPLDIDRYDRYFNVALETMTTDSVHSGQRAVNVLEEVVPDYVIITNNQLKSAFQKLADWRTKTGMPAIIKTVEEIECEYRGGYLVDKIRNYLLDVQKRWGNNSLFILLGGDIEIVPSRIILG